MQEYIKYLKSKINNCKKELEGKKCDEIEKTVLISQCEAYYDSLHTFKNVYKKHIKSTRLTELRKEKQLSIRELAMNVDFHYSTIALIEEEKITPSLDVVASLCDYFNCSIDYFLYRSDTR